MLTAKEELGVPVTAAGDHQLILAVVLPDLQHTTQPILQMYDDVAPQRADGLAADTKHTAVKICHAP